MNKLFATEVENMQMVEHCWMLAGAEEKLLRGNATTKAKARAKQA